MLTMKTDRLNFIILFLVALILRLLFSFYFQQFYFGKFEFEYGDGFTYLLPIINLINKGEYVLDDFLNDSKYFRVPVYPFFLGLFYIISPENIFRYVVVTAQCILGSVTAVMVYYSIFNISPIKKAALISGFLYATYPFVILWTPLVYTETVQFFLILFLVCLATNNKINYFSILIQGCLVGLMVLTKQYLGLIIIIPIYIIIFVPSLSFRQRLSQLLVLVMGFSLVLSPWIIRNYISSGRIIIFFGETSGLRNALEDMVAFGRFTNKFDENQTPLVKSVAYTGTVELLKHPQFVTKHKGDIELATMLAYSCGGSFQQRRKPISLDQPPYENCNHKVVLAFNTLNEIFWQEVPFWEAMETRRDALYKIISKSDLVNKNLNMNKSDLMKYALFKYRIALLILGLSGMLYLLIWKIKQREQKIFIGAILVTALAFYSFFCLVMVSAEMRYLLIPDVLISIFSGVIPAELMRNISTQKQVIKQS